MASRSRTQLIILALTILPTIILSACVTETVEVTRIKILERRVIERSVVTVEVTRIQQPVETPKPTRNVLTPPTATATLSISPSPPPATVTPTAPRTTRAATATPVPSTNWAGESLSAAMKDTEQVLLSLIRAVNSDPLPIDQTVQLYDALRGAPTITIPEGNAEMQSIYVRYREQIDYVFGQANDLYNHAKKIQSGEAEQKQISPIHLSLAQDAASVGTSTVQSLIRELDTLLASQS